MREFAVVPCCAAGVRGFAATRRTPCAGEWMSFALPSSYDPQQGSQEQRAETTSYMLFLEAAQRGAVRNAAVVPLALPESNRFNTPLGHALLC